MNIQILNLPKVMHGNSFRLIQEQMPDVVSRFSHSFGKVRSESLVAVEAELDDICITGYLSNLSTGHHNKVTIHVSYRLIFLEGLTIHVYPNERSSIHFIHLSSLTIYSCQQEVIVDAIELSMESSLTKLCRFIRSPVIQNIINTRMSSLLKVSERRKEGASLSPKKNLQR